MESYDIAKRFLNALILSGLSRGKELQLWDSNVHCKEAQYGAVLQVPGKRHN